MKKKLSKSQKKRIIQWEIPHLIQLLEKEYKVSLSHLILPLFSSVYQKDWFIFGQKLAFPLFLEEHFLGALICSRSLSLCSARKIRIFIDHYLQKQTAKLFSPCYFRKRGNLKKQQVFSESAIKACLIREQAETSTVENLNQYFPLLLRQNKKEEILKVAHDLYLKSSSFAFLNTEDLQWKKKLFQEMQGVFVCVPSFKALSPFQKKVLKEDLISKKLSCKLVLGLPEKALAPKEWLALFSLAL